MKPILGIFLIICFFSIITAEIRTDSIIKSVELAKNIDDALSHNDQKSFLKSVTKLTSKVPSSLVHLEMFSSS
jgi:hypothetical protein